MTSRLQTVPACSGRIYSPVHDCEDWPNGVGLGGGTGFGLLAAILCLIGLIGIAVLPDIGKLVLAFFIVFLLPVVALRSGRLRLHHSH